MPRPRRRPTPGPTPAQVPVARASVAPPQRHAAAHPGASEPAAGHRTSRPGAPSATTSNLPPSRRRPGSQSARARRERPASSGQHPQPIARALQRCQRQPLPAPEAAAIKVDYRVSLNRDGSLASAEFVRVLNVNPALEKYERRMRDLALNVINACTPIRGLPAEFYDVPGGWRQFPYQFDPRTVR